MPPVKEIPGVLYSLLFGIKKSRNYSLSGYKNIDFVRKYLLSPQEQNTPVKHGLSVRVSVYIWHGDSEARIRKSKRAEKAKNFELNKL